MATGFYKWQHLPPDNGDMTLRKQTAWCLKEKLSPQEKGEKKMTHDIVWTPERLVDKTLKEMSGRRLCSSPKCGFSGSRQNNEASDANPSIPSFAIQLRKHKNTMGPEFWSYIYLEIKRRGNTMTKNSKMMKRQMVLYDAFLGLRFHVCQMGLLDSSQRVVSKVTGDRQGKVFYR